LQRFFRMPRPDPFPEARGFHHHVRLLLQTHAAQGHRLQNRQRSSHKHLLTVRPDVFVKNSPNIIYSVTQMFLWKTSPILLTVWPGVYVKNSPNIIDSVTICFVKKLDQYYWQCDQMFFCEKLAQFYWQCDQVFLKNLPNIIDSATRWFCEELAQYYWQCDHMFCKKTRPILLTVWPNVFCEKLAQFYWQCDQVFLWRTCPILLTVRPDGFVKNLPNIIDSVTICFVKKLDQYYW
jgi:hypothetical protein